MNSKQVITNNAICRRRILRRLMTLLTISLTPMLAQPAFANEQKNQDPFAEDNDPFASSNDPFSQDSDPFATDKTENTSDVNSQHQSRIEIKSYYQTIYLLYCHFLLLNILPLSIFIK